MPHAALTLTGSGNSFRGSRVFNYHILGLKKLCSPDFLLLLKKGEKLVLLCILTPSILRTASIPWTNHLVSPIEDDSSEEYQQFEVLKETQRAKFNQYLLRIGILLFSRRNKRDFCTVICWRIVGLSMHQVCTGHYRRKVLVVDVISASTNILLL